MQVSIAIMAGSKLSTEFFELVKAIGESKTKQVGAVHLTLGCLQRVQGLPRVLHRRKTAL